MHRQSYEAYIRQNTGQYAMVAAEARSYVLCKVA